MSWRTKLLNFENRERIDFKSLVTPVYRGSTVVFSDQESVRDHWEHSKQGYSYGLYGTPTTLELGARISELESAHHTFIVPGGQAAIALVYLTFCKAGSHALIPYSVYGPNKEMAEGLLKGLGIEVEEYDPLIGAGIKYKVKRNTSLIWCESPGSVTMEVQDIPAIVSEARKLNIFVALDNTYSAGVLFDAFKSEVDISIQALTKYIGGHSDLILGSVSVRDEKTYTALGDTYRQLGLAVSPDDCSLALRGLQTLGIRLDHFEKSALNIANWIAKKPIIESVFHPALPSCPGHLNWKRDFLGSSSLFSFLFNETVGEEKVKSFINSLEVFQIGLSWGGVNSLAIVYPDLKRPKKEFSGRLIRLNIGLEDTTDLIKDLENAFEKAFA